MERIFGYFNDSMTTKQQRKEDFIMKKRLVNIVVSALMLVSMGCATPQMILLKDGRTIESRDMPDYDKKTGFYEFETEEGKKIKVNKNEVVEIKEK
jgi:Bacterial protein of unknown function (DUF903)